MNKEQRKAIASVIDDINGLDGFKDAAQAFQDAIDTAFVNFEAEIADIKSKAEDAVSEVEAIRDAEQETLDNMPESLQSSEKGEAIGEAVNSLEAAIESLQSIAEYEPEAPTFDDPPDGLGDAIACLEEAMGG